MKICPICKWVLLNVPMFMLIIAGFLTGFITPIFGDITFITHAISLIFIFTVLYTGYIAFDLNRDVNNIEEWRNGFRKNSTETSKEILFNNLESRLEFPRFIAKMLLSLGFLGTVVGVIVAFAHMPENAFTNPEAMQSFVRVMMQGFSIELHTLLAGIVTKLWLDIVNYTIDRDLNNFYLGIINDK